ncbi:broad substrate specificity ATP-binding cassette transporter ABCG2 [Aplysia californica]|uniref:Broad substrate specificity ATP-binding cassette transporter ABCG2 n=1 Tax=Aplysia californica TaxID=6500 RepID=A0ABM0ZWZ5_APLCA|nr:broad substrate specificity ATP-binding cassette transporter ABCG2 [Aplysia californica]
MSTDMNGHQNPAFSSHINIEMTKVGPENGPAGPQVVGGQGSVLSAHNMGYTVPVSKGCCKGSEDKQILTNVTGIFKPGMNAILGPTGSGKSSFLDVLAGHKEMSRVSGLLLLDGKPVPDNFKCMVGYVVQDDVVMGTLSIRENFAFSAALRLPQSVSQSERRERVEQVIKELGLVKCADTKVGNEFLRGVSGGERKRCNIGMELIISPPVLFLDEPTTGLDANTANSVLMFLRRLSRRGRTIIFSIHQPRYTIYRMFDNLMLLSGGHTVYHGPAQEALTFFAEQGFVCQEHNNPPDFFLDVINGDPTAMSLDEEKELDPDTAANTSQHDKLVGGFKSSRWNSLLESEAEEIVTQFQAHGGRKGERHEEVEYATSFGHQFTVVAGRAVKNIIRNPQTSVITLATTIFFAIIISAIYWQLEEKPGSGFADRKGVFFFLVMNQLFLNMSAVEVFINERKIFMHENISGFYRVSVYFLVKIFFDMLPLRLIPVVVMSLIVYFTVGLQMGVDHFFLFMLGLFCVTMSAASLCFFISSTVRVFAVAQLLLALCYVLMMLFGGFLISLSSIGVWVNWAKYLSIFKYGLALLCINEFKDRAFCSNATTCDYGNFFLEQQEIDYKDSWDFWHNYVALGLIAFILLALTYIQLRLMKKHN